MSEGLLCIDFGSSYTKVALRRGRRTNSEMVTGQREAVDEFKICLPSTVVTDTTGGVTKYTFGVAAEGRRPSLDGSVRPHANWKKDLFTEPPADAAPVPAAPRGYQPRTSLERLVLSKDLRRLAERCGVSDRELQTLRQLVVCATSLTTPFVPGAPAPVAPSPGSELHNLAVGFFRWLRQAVGDAGRALSPQFQLTPELPTRVTVPAFCAEDKLAGHPGVVRLTAALREAGWNLHPDRPFVSEPYSNAIGILTQGSNCTRGDEMFQKGLLITALKDAKHYPVYRVVVIDVGSYTTDFAALTLDTRGQTLTLEDAMSRFTHQAESVALGMGDLDEAVLAALDPRNQQYMRDEATPDDWTKLRDEVYVRRRSLAIQSGTIGGRQEMQRLHAAFVNFEARLTAEANRFMGSTHLDTEFRELILTGGGCTIPAVQRALICGAQTGRAVFRKVHLPRNRIAPPAVESTLQQVVVPLEGVLPRGGTALGGASAYFSMTPSAERGA